MRWWFVAALLLSLLGDVLLTLPREPSLRAWGHFSRRLTWPTSLGRHSEESAG